MVSIYGSEAERHLLCCCLAGVDIVGLGNGENSSVSSKSNNTSKEKEKEQLQLLSEYFGQSITQPAFPSLLNSALEQPLRNNSTRSVQHQLKISFTFINNFCRFLRLSRSQEVVLRIALLETFSPEARSQSILVIRQKLGELLKNFADQDRNTAPLEGGLQVNMSSQVMFIFLGLTSFIKHRNHHLKSFIIFSAAC